MTKQQARKIAYRRAAEMINLTIRTGWNPNEGGEYQYSIYDSKKILDSLKEICGQLYRRSRGNLESI